MRLIDADELQEKLDYTINVAESMRRKTFELKGLKKIVADIPTACDIDKVRADVIDEVIQVLDKYTQELNGKEIWCQICNETLKDWITSWKIALYQWLKEKKDE